MFDPDPDPDLDLDPGSDYHHQAPPGPPNSAGFVVHSRHTPSSPLHPVI